MPTLEIDFVLVTVVASLIFGGGWQAHSWYAESHHAADLQNQIDATNIAAKKAYDVGNQFEIETQDQQNERTAWLTKWRVSNEKPHAVCVLSDSSIELLKSKSAKYAAPTKPNS